MPAGPGPVRSPGADGGRVRSGFGRSVAPERRCRPVTSGAQTTEELFERLRPVQYGVQSRLAGPGWLSMAAARRRARSRPGRRARGGASGHVGGLREQRLGDGGANPEPKTASVAGCRHLARANDSFEEGPGGVVGGITRKRGRSGQRREELRSSQRTGRMYPRKSWRSSAAASRFRSSVGRNRTPARRDGGSRSRRAGARRTLLPGVGGSAPRGSARPRSPARRQNRRVGRDREACTNAPIPASAAASSNRGATMLDRHWARRRRVSGPVPGEVDDDVDPLEHGSEGIGDEIDGSELDALTGVPAVRAATPDDEDGADAPVGGEHGDEARAEVSRAAGDQDAKRLGGATPLLPVSHSVPRPPSDRRHRHRGVDRRRDRPPPRHRSGRRWSRRPAPAGRRPGALLVLAPKTRRSISSTSSRVSSARGRGRVRIGGRVVGSRHARAA